MEELFVYALLLDNEMITADEYKNYLDKMFLENLENDTLLHLEWEMNIKKSLAYIRECIDYKTFDSILFGKCLMAKIDKYYRKYDFNIKYFANKMYDLWKNLPDNIQYQEPFWSLSYADEPLSWGDEKQTRAIYENIISYYKD